ARLCKDIDLAVPVEAADQAMKCLLSLGYQPGEDTRQIHHLPIMHSRIGGVPVEVHLELLRSEFQPLLPAKDVFKRASARNLDGHSFLMPSPTDLVLHIIIHAQLQDMGYRTESLNMNSLYDVLVCDEHYQGMVDWREIVSACSSHHYDAVW